MIQVVHEKSGGVTSSFVLLFDWFYQLIFSQKDGGMRVLRITSRESRM